MSLVHIIGNGFDLNAGLNTRYEDFYKYYLRGYTNPSDETKAVAALFTDNELIRDFKKDMYEEMTENVITWSDLERALGQYSRKIRVPEDFIEIIEDVNNSLTKYLRGIEASLDKYPFSNDVKKLFIHDLLHPESYVNSARREAFEIANTGEKLSVVSFNYTNTVESLLPPGVDISVFHVHGTLELESEVILGVDSVEQIGNYEFRGNTEVTNAFLKPKSSVLKDDEGTDIIVNSCKREIENAKVISVFGCSLGLTDETWWNLIRERVVTDDLKVILFNKTDPKRLVKGYRREAERSRVIGKFCNKKVKALNRFNDNVTVVSNTGMFDIFEKVP